MKKWKINKKIKLILATTIPFIAFSTVISCQEVATPSNPPRKEEPKNIENNEYINQYLITHFDEKIKDYKLTPSYQLWKFFDSKINEKIKLESKADVSKIFINDFIQNLTAEQNLFLNDRLVDKNDSQIDWKNVNYEIDFANVTIDSYDEQKLVVPVKFIFNSINNKKRIKIVNYYLEGFKIDEEHQNLKTKLDEYVKNLNVYSENQTIKKFDINKDVSIFEFLENFKKYKHYLKQFKNDLLDFVEFDKNTLNENKKIEDEIEFNTFLSDVKLNFEKTNSLSLIYRFTAEKNRKIVGKNLEFKVEGFKALNENEIKKYLNQIVSLDIESHLSKYHIDYDKFNVNDLNHFKAISKNSKINFDVIKIEKDENNPKSFKITLKSESEINSLNNITFTKNWGIPKKGYLFKDEQENWQDSTNNYNLKLVELTQENLTQIENTLAERTDAKILSGGFLDNRGIYLNPNSGIQVHLGEDVMVPANTLLHAPFKGKIVGGVYLPSQTFGQGIGAALFYEVDRENLDIDQEILDNELFGIEKFYFKFIHLDFNYFKQIGEVITLDRNGKQIHVLKASFKDPIEVEKGDVIGRVADKTINGGWVPHVDVVVWNGTKGLSNNYERNEEQKILDSIVFDKNNKEIKISASVISDKRIETANNNINKNENPNLPTISVHLKSGIKNVKKTDSTTKIATNEDLNPDELDEKIKKLPYVNITQQNKIFDRKNPVKGIDKRFNVLDPNLFFQFVNKESLVIQLEDFFEKAKN
ncbi:MSC_0775 family lipoprotein [[Mycoplasma] collis]|uniref:MSC_0775 family lipoprotein n=1 Tax=[Mycoplasma] collis TaxID=2127 RepID=UPI00051C2A7E|nr:hypothetical protein [[Mycoplasma] collis]